MKAYRISYLRVGRKELWAGWRVPGMSKGISGNTLNAYKTLQSSNSSVETLTAHYDAASVIYEFVCENGTVCFSRLTYGIKDMLGRAAMRADGVVLSSAENPGLLKSLGAVLEAPEACFDNRIYIDEAYKKTLDEHGDTSVFGLKDMPTVLDDCDISPVARRTGTVFPDMLVREQVVLAFYWALTTRSNSTLYLISDNTDREKLSFFAEMFSYLPYQLRTRVAFHTKTVNRKKLLPFEFSATKPAAGCYINIGTGESNIGGFTRRFREYSFITYLLSLPNEAARNEYFEKIDQKTSAVGVKESADPGVFQTAHMMLTADSPGDDGLTDIELVKKLHSSLLLPAGNPAVENVCAKLIKETLRRCLTVRQEVVYTLIRERLSSASDAEFIEYGCAMLAGQLLRRQDMTESFESLSKFDPALLPVIEKKLTEAGGQAFVEKYYTEFLPPRELRLTGRLEADLETADAYLKKTAHLSGAGKIRETAFSKYAAIAEEAVRQYCKKQLRLADFFPLFSKHVRAALPEYSARLEEHFAEYFLKTFDYRAYSFDETENYEAVLQGSRTGGVIRELDLCFNEIAVKKNASVQVVQNLKRIFDENRAEIGTDGIVAVTKEFQRCCIRNINKAANLDFWFCAARLWGSGYLDFILSEEITVFTNPMVFERNISNANNKSSLFMRDETLEYMLSGLKAYSAQHKRDKNYREYIEIVSDMTEVIKEEMKRRSGGRVKNGEKTGGIFGRFKKQ